MGSRSSGRRLALTLFGCVLFTATAAVAAPPDHVHVKVEIVVPRAETSGAGDALGLYAVQLLPCAGSAQSSTQSSVLNRLWASALVAGDRLLGVLVSTAHANHRERFDGPAAAEFGKRVPLDRAATTTVGTLIAPLGTYCKVGLVLARLPSHGKDAALPFALRLSNPAGQVLLIEHREDLEIPLTKPWNASASATKLTVILLPGRALQALGLPNMEEGERMQRAVVSFAKEATASIHFR